MITVKQTDFEGLYILNVPLFNDERGGFRKYFSAEDFYNLSLDTNFKESYYSVNKRNVIRGMHFQIPPAEHTKVVYVSAGSIIDVCLDIRKESKTFGKCFSVLIKAT